jgi:hypothetical protein
VDDNYQTDASCVLERRKALITLFQGCEYAKEIKIYIHDNTQNHTQPSSRYQRGDITMIIDK